MVSRRAKILLVVGTVAACNLALFSTVLSDRKYIREIAYGIVPPAAAQADIVEALVAYCRDRLVKNTAEDVAAKPFHVQLNYLYNPCRLGPKTVLDHGMHHVGPCQSASRVFAELCTAHGLDSRVVGLHNATLNGLHSMVEVEYDGSLGIVDPLYGIVFKKSDGRPASLQELRADPRLFKENARHGFQYLKQPDGKRARANYPVDDYPFAVPLYFSYRRFGMLRQPIYDTLTYLFGPDGPLLVKRPRLIGRYPAVALAVALDAACAAALLAYLVARRWTGRNRQKPSGDSTTPANEPATRSSVDSAAGASRAAQPTHR